MAKEAKKDPQEFTVEQKLKTLYQLQTTLSKIDEIKTLRGELPLEVQDLEDEIAGLNTRVERIKSEIAELKTSIATKKVEIETAKASVAKYKDQQDNVRNNREYDFLSKEIEFQTLEIELCEKRIREFTEQEETKPKEVESCSHELEERKTNWRKLSRRRSRKKRSSGIRPKIWKRRLSLVCSNRSSASARTRATGWVSSTCNVTRAEVASTRFRPSASWTSVRARKSSCANIAAAS